MTPEEAASRAAHPARGTARGLHAVADGSGNPACSTCGRPLMLMDARWVHLDGSRDHGGPATRRYVLWLLSPVEVDAEDADAAAAAGPAAVHALLHDAPGILEFDAQEVDDDAGA